MERTEVYDKLRARATGVEYHYYIIVGFVQGPEEFIDLFDMLQNASPEDMVFLHINTPGGNLDTVLQLVHSIQNSKAVVIGAAEGEVASAGSIIFFACDSFIINPYSHFLLHDGSTGVIGKLNENLKAAQAGAVMLHKLYHDVYGRFFSKKAVNKILNGEDRYLSAGDVERVMQKYQEKMEKVNGE